MRDAILKAAAALREDLEAFALYWHKVRGADIMVDKMENGQMSLLGACGIASWVMWRALKRAGFHDAEMVAGWYRVYTDEDRVFETTPYFGSHCWVVVEGKLLDLTATQFGRPEPVYVTEPGQDENYAVLNVGALYGDISYSIRKWKADVEADAERRLMDWDTQSPFRRDYRPDLQVMEDKVVALLEAA